MAKSGRFPFLFIFKFCILLILGLLLSQMIYSDDNSTCEYASETGIYRGTIEIVIDEVLLSISGSYLTIRITPPR